MRGKLLLLVLLPIAFLFSFRLFALGTCSAEQRESIEATQAFLSLRSKPELIKKELIHTRKYYRKNLYTIKARNQEKTEEIKFYYYETNAGEEVKKPVVILFSSVGGITLLERYVAYYLAKKGISTIVSELSEMNSVDKIEKISPYLISSLYSSLNIMDFVENHPKINADKMATIGVSLGGFRALYLSALDLRIKSATLVVSGSSIVETLAQSTLPFVKELRALQMENMGLDAGDNEAYLEMLQHEIMFKVEDLVCQRKTSDYLLFHSRNDTIVPYKQQNTLYSLLGNPKREIRSFLGHRGTAIHFGLSKLGKTTEFIKSHW